VSWWSRLSMQERYALLGVGLGSITLVGVMGFVASRRSRVMDRIGTVEVELTPAQRQELRRTFECGRDDIVRGLSEAAQASARPYGGPEPTKPVVDLLAQQLYLHLGVTPPSRPC
jgi:hypothetical protein